LFASQIFLGVDVTGVFGQVKGSLNSTFKHNVPAEGAIRVRLGYMLDQQFSIYVAGGPGASYRKTTDFAGVTGNGIEAGGQVGLGVEYRFLPDWRLRAEYAFTWPGFGAATITGSPSASWNPTEHLIRLGAIRRF
jgi:opacity protein-like surface antigen